MEKAGKIPEAGVALTFDDTSIDNWYKYLPFFDSLGVKATFYISSYHKLSPGQVAKLKIIEKHGHEIGYHTTNHIDIPKYILRYECEQLFKQEIYPDLIKMRQDGFNPVVFAYPYGSHTSGTNKLLLPFFKSLRALNGSQNLAKSLAATENETILYGIEMDDSGYKKDGTYDDLLNSSKKNNNCLILVGHMIEEGGTKFKVPLNRLKYLINGAKKRNLKFYTISEISKK